MAHYQFAIVTIFCYLLCEINGLARVDNTKWAYKRPNVTTHNQWQHHGAATTHTPYQGWNTTTATNQYGRFNQTAQHSNWARTNGTQQFPGTQPVQFVKNPVHSYNPQQNFSNWSGTRYPSTAPRNNLSTWNLHNNGQQNWRNIQQYPSVTRPNNTNWTHNINNTRFVPQNNTYNWLSPQQYPAGIRPQNQTTNVWPYGANTNTGIKGHTNFNPTTNFTYQTTPRPQYPAPAFGGGQPNSWSFNSTRTNIGYNTPHASPGGGWQAQYNATRQPVPTYINPDSVAPHSGIDNPSGNAPQTPYGSAVQLAPIGGFGSSDFGSGGPPAPGNPAPNTGFAPLAGNSPWNSGNTNSGTPVPTLHNPSSLSYGNGQLPAENPNNRPPAGSTNPYANLFH